MAKEYKYLWTDNPTSAGIAKCDTDVLNDCLMHLKYDKGVRNLGEYVWSSIPLTDAALHLPDGTILDGNGIYKDFVNEIADIYSKYPSLFVSESDWQASVEQYGVCGKFVYDPTANTVRLPKVTGFVEGTLDANALGDLIEAGLPNITGAFNGDILSEANRNASGAFATGSPWTMSTSSAGQDQSQNGFTFDASRSNPIYGKSNTVQTQSILGYMYIVVATTTKTDIEIDIDNIATDLNNKVDVSNMVNAGSYIANCAMPSDKYIDLTLGASGLTYTAPANGYFCFYRMPNDPAGYSSLVITNTGFITEARNTVRGAGNGIWTLARKNDVIQLNYDGAGTVTCWRFYYAEGEVE